MTVGLPASPPRTVGDLPGRTTESFVSLILSQRQAYFDDHLAVKNNATSGRLRPICEKWPGEGNMPKDTEDSGARNGLSRRSLFKQLGLAGAAAAVSETPFTPSDAALTT